MIRRKFLQLLALAGSGAIAPIEALSASSATMAIFQVKGFTCITCAVGLDTMMERRKGVLSSHSTYPEGKVTVRFDQTAINLESIRAIITDAGFTLISG